VDQIRRDNIYGLDSLTLALFSGMLFVCSTFVTRKTGTRKNENVTWWKGHRFFFPSAPFRFGRGIHRAGKDTKAYREKLAVKMPFSHAAMNNYPFRNHTHSVKKCNTLVNKVCAREFLPDARATLLSFVLQPKTRCAEKDADFARSGGARDCTQCKKTSNAFLFLGARVRRPTANKQLTRMTADGITVYRRQRSKCTHEKISASDKLLVIVFGVCRFTTPKKLRVFSLEHKILDFINHQPFHGAFFGSIDLRCLKSYKTESSNETIANSKAASWHKT
jgi:hypothetical protein